MTKPIVTCKMAKAAGLKRYFSGRPCVNGHLADRLVSNGTCVECASIRADAWVKRNPEKRRAAEKRMHEKRPEHYKAKEKAKYLARNEEVREVHRVAALQWKRANAEKVVSYMAVWRKANKHLVTADSARRSAQLRNAYPSWADHDAILTIYEECRRLTEQTGIKYHVDHIVPLRGKTVCGLHVHYNLQILEGRKNCAKGNRLLEAA